MITLRVHDLSLRSRVRGGHGRADAYCLAIAHALDAAGVDIIEIADGGIAGRPLDSSTLRWCETVAAGLRRARLAITVRPRRYVGMDVAILQRHGVDVVRILSGPGQLADTRRTMEAAHRAGAEIDVVLPWVENGLAAIVAQAVCLARAGVQSLTVADMAGRLLPSSVAGLFDALRAATPADTVLGIEPHPSLTLGVANAVVATEHGARRLCGSLGGIGQGVGAVPLETMVAAAERIGYRTSGCLVDLIDIAEDLVRPLGELPIGSEPSRLDGGLPGLLGIH